MAYRIKPDKPFTDQVQAAAIAQLRSAVDALRQQPHGVHEAVHAARKNFKRVRALYRLVASDARDVQKAENARLRQAAASLSRVRDATALIETVEYLQDQPETPEEQAALANALLALASRRDRYAAAEHDLDDKVAAAIGDCEQAIEAVSRLQFDDRPHKTARRLAKAWRKDLDHACAALAACKDSAHAEHFHQLRKCGQSYWMHLALLSAIWPSALGAKRALAKQLVDMLGHEHDLALLVAVVDEEPDLLSGGEELSHLLGAVIRQQQALRREAIDLAERVFADEPQDEADIIATLWLQACR
ncbi:MAG: CHAD domain-containing protein [Allorhizobium sp.]